MAFKNDDLTYVYVIATSRRGRAAGPVKIGISSNPQSRLNSLQSGNPERLVMFCHMAIFGRDAAKSLERMFHTIQQDRRLDGEWFDLTPKGAAYSLKMDLACCFMEYNDIAPSDALRYVESLYSGEIHAVA